MEYKARTGGAPAVQVIQPAVGEQIDPVLESLALPGPPPPVDPVLGVLAGWDEAGRPLVAVPGGPTEGPLPAVTVVPLAIEQVGHEVAVLFLGGEPRRPLVIGVVQPPGPTAPAPMPGKIEASADGERLEFTAGKEIVFRCGAARITLTKAGKVLIEGAYLLSRSTGVNRVKGGSVQIN